MHPINWGDPRLPNRFWKKVSDDWVWTGASGPHGYGNWWFKGVWLKPHRLMCELVHGPPEHGWVAMHSCDTRLCVNPEHLNWGTAQDNSTDMKLKGRGRNQNTGKTHCKKGHEFTEENTMWVRNKTKRRCKTCAYRKAGH